MEVSDFFVFDGFGQELNISAIERNFQQSIIIKQDPNKSGILSFLSKIEQETGPTRPERQSPPTQRSLSTQRPTEDYGRQ